MGHRTFKIVESRQSYSNGHSSICYLAPALMDDEVCEFACAVAKDSQKQLIIIIIIIIIIIMT